jgi:hypothetical protein
MNALQPPTELADWILSQCVDIDVALRMKLRRLIADAIEEDRRVLNCEIQLRLGSVRVSQMEDLDRVRREIEDLLHHPKRLL